MNIRHLIKPALFFLIFLFPHKNLFASHIIGGEIIYKWLYGSTYEITLKFYRDCSAGFHADADSVVHLYVYNSKDSIILDVNIPLPPRDTVPNNTYNLCLFAPPDICIEQTTYTYSSLILPDNPAGCYLAFQRCCRNNTIINITDPGNTGSTWYLDFADTADANHNSSPVFSLYPPTLICINDTFEFDHSATDADGDSLVYDICQPYVGGNAFNAIPTPTPPKSAYTLLTNYAGGYSWQNPLGAAANLKIDPQTGRLTCKPTQLGKYVVAICVSEYRKGKLLSVNKRDFQFNVVNCISDFTAEFLFTQDKCDSSLVSFKDNSYYVYNSSKIYIDSMNYIWDFDDGATDTLENPVHAYSAPGTYNVKLTVNPGLVCEDSFMSVVNVGSVATMNPDFSAPQVCPDDTVTFTDASVIPLQNGNIIQWIWDYGDGTIDSTTIPATTHIYPDGSSYNATLIITTDTGCKRTDTVTKTIAFFPQPVVDVTPVSESIIIGESVQLTATGASTYQWLPPTYLNTSTGPAVTSTPGNNISYLVVGTDANGCVDTSLAATIVVEQPVAVDVPTAFTPNGDSRNDVFRIYNMADSLFSGAESIDFKIFNRWGEVIFETSDPLKPWDGKNRSGKDMEIGVYVWVVSVKTKTGETLGPYYGNVSLIR